MLDCNQGTKRETRMTNDRDKRIKSIVELEPNDLDKVVGGVSGSKATLSSHAKAEQKSKFSDEPKTFTSSEEARKGA